MKIYTNRNVVNVTFVEKQKSFPNQRILLHIILLRKKIEALLSFEFIFRYLE